MMNDGLKDIDENKIVGVLSGFSRAFSILGHNLLSNKLTCYGFFSLLFYGLKVTLPTGNVPYSLMKLF